MDDKALPVKIKTDDLGLFYGDFRALKNITMEIYACRITAIIGPSGCGKSSLLRVFNRMNDLLGARTEGLVTLDDFSLYDRETDVSALRKKVGMVFQKPNVFPMSVYENVVLAPKRHGAGRDKRLAEIAEKSLTQVALWDEVKDGLNKPGLSLSPGQQQRLCIARALAVEPEVLLMDESCSALDPESTMKIEELILELAERYTIIIVTHNMEQALRISDYAAFIMIGEDKAGTIVEYSPTDSMFANPADVRTEDYITGRFG